MASDRSCYNSECKKDEEYRVKSKSVKLYRNRRPPNNLPGIGQRHILGFYSMNADYEFTDDLSQLRYLKRPPAQNVNFDLKITSKQTIKRKLTTNETKIDSLLKWIVNHRQNCFEPSVSRDLIEFVSYRGLLIKVMVSPYERFEGWIICAAKFQGRIYLCRYETLESEQKNAARTDKMKELCDWGYVFEQYLVSENPEQPPNLNVPTNQNEEFCCVFRSKLGPHNIFFGAEMDGLIIDEKKGSLTGPERNSENLKKMLETEDACFVELKTSADARNNKWEWQKICRHKSLRWWTQCNMAGIKEVICGYRDDNGIVSYLDSFSVRDLPNLGRNFWDPNVCLDYCTRFLDLVEEHVWNGPEEIIWKFEWNPKNPDDIDVETCGSDSQYLFLHKWFTNVFRGNLKRKAESDESVN